ncbi:YIP1 family protein [Candidatus Daviesbacteria bacterium]|nr:YIP1 family protein [Candidatus Daviesbacteria bacterium]
MARQIINNLNYFQLIIFSILKTNKFSKQIAKIKKIRRITVFCFLNITLGSLIGFVLQLITSKNYNQAFFIVAEILQINLFFIIILILFTPILYYLAKVMGGSGTFKSTFLSIASSSGPLLVFWIPYLRLISLSLIVFILTSNFVQTHKYSPIKAAINILFPTILFISLLMMLNIIKSPIFLT